MARRPLSLHPCAGVDRCPACIRSIEIWTRTTRSIGATRAAPFGEPRCLHLVLASIGGSRVFARPRRAREASATSAAAKPDKHPIRLHLVLAGRERFGCGSRRRRRRQRESRHEPVADDRRAGGAGVRVLAEPGRNRPTAPRWAHATSGWSRWRPLRGRAPQWPFREHPGAFAADRALELVGNPCPLHDDMGADGTVPVWEPEAARWTSHCYSM